jgi:DNA-binding HxlR family transcriptional regulator
VTGKRTYGEGCAVAHALDLVGDRWALLVVRELLLGPKRFTDLRRGILHASANALTQRLRDLERTGVIQRRRLEPPAASSVYELTDWGRELEPVVLGLGHWGSRSPSMPHGAAMSADSIMLALKTMFSADSAGDLRAGYGVRLGEHRFRIVVSDGRLELGRGALEDPDAIIETDSATLSAVVFGDRTLAGAEGDGAARIVGDRDAVERLLTLFPSGPDRGAPG